MTRFRWKRMYYLSETGIYVRAEATLRARRWPGWSAVGRSAWLVHVLLVRSIQGADRYLAVAARGNVATRPTPQKARPIPSSGTATAMMAVLLADVSTNGYSNSIKKKIAKNNATPTFPRKLAGTDSNRLYADPELTPKAEAIPNGG